MSSADYLSGALAFAVLIGGAAISATAIVARRRAADLRGAPRAVAWGLVASGFVFAAHLIPGALGGLTAGTVAVTAVMLTAIALSIPERLLRPEVEPPPQPGAEPRWSLWLGLGAVAALAAYMLGWAFENGAVALGQSDVVSFHLPNVAQWIQDGSLWGVHDWIPNRAPGNYPQTGDVYMLAAILPWDSDFIVRFVSYPFVALLVLAVRSAARELGAGAGLSWLIAAALAAIPAISYVATSGLADPEMYGLFAAGGFFLIRHRRSGDRFDLVLAGVGLGLAFGTRWYAVPAVGAVVVVWLAATLWPAGRRRQGLIDAASLIGLIALVGGFWLLRNWIESGNPVFPVDVSPLGIAIFDAPRDLYRELYGFTLANYLTDFEVIGDYIWSSFLDFLSLTTIALWLGVLAAAVLALRRRGPRAGTIVGLAVIAVIIGIAYIGTPYTAAGEEGAPFEAWVNSRYMVPALICAAPALAWLISRFPRLLPFALVLVALATADALRRAMDFPGGDVPLGAWVLAGAVLAIVAVAALALRRIKLDSVPRGLRIAVAAAFVAAVAYIGGAAQERRFNEDRYTDLGPEVDYVNAAEAGSRIGLVGDGFVNYPLFGPRLENEVVYVGKRRAEMLRPILDEREFAAALAAGNYDFVAWRSLDTLDERVPLLQAEWLRNAGWRRVERGNNPLLNSEVAIYLPPKPPNLEWGEAVAG